MGPVLLIDNDESLLAHHSDRLRARGMRVVAAFSDDEALDYCQTFPVAVLVCRHRRHRLDTHRLFRAARLHLPLVRGILVSTDIDEEAARHAAQIGFDDVIYLPSRDDEELTRSVARSYALLDLWEERLRAFDRPSAPIYWQSAGFSPARSLHAATA